MKTLQITLALVLVLAMGASAQLPSKPFNVYVGAGITLPDQPDRFKDVYNMGLHGTAGLGLNVAPMIQLVGKLGYHGFGMDKDDYGSIEAVAGVDGGTFTVFTYGVDARISIGAPLVPVKPFGFVGLGMASLVISEITADTNPLSEWSSSKLYYNFGGGLEFKTGPALTFFIQAAYISIAGDTDAKAFGGTDNRIVMIPISLGLKF